jgi:hypothetical protein
MTSNVVCETHLAINDVAGQSLRGSGATICGAENRTKITALISLGANEGQSFLQVLSTVHGHALSRGQRQCGQGEQTESLSPKRKEHKTAFWCDSIRNRCIPCPIQHVRVNANTLARRASLSVHRAMHTRTRRYSTDKSCNRSFTVHEVNHQWASIFH